MLCKSKEEDQNDLPLISRFFMVQTLSSLGKPSDVEVMSTPSGTSHTQEHILPGGSHIEIVYTDSSVTITPDHPNISSQHTKSCPDLNMDQLDEFNVNMLNSLANTQDSQSSLTRHIKCKRSDQTSQESDRCISGNASHHVRISSSGNVKMRFDYHNMGNDIHDFLSGSSPHNENF